MYLGFLEGAAPPEVARPLHAPIKERKTICTLHYPRTSGTWTIQTFLRCMSGGLEKAFSIRSHWF